MIPYDKTPLGDEATIQFIPFGENQEFHLRDGSGSCVILTLEELLRLKDLLLQL